MLSGQETGSNDRAREVLVETLRAWTERLKLARLSGFGMAADDLERVVAGSRGSSMKTNPLVLTDEEIAAIVTARL